MTNFSGSALKLQAKDWGEIASMINVTEAHLRTVVEVETSGRGFDISGHPEILFERHIFYRELGNTPERKIAEGLGLAYKQWRTRPYPKNAQARWAEFQRACKINERAAIRSTSWGLGQIMGSEFDECQYSTPEKMVEAFCESEYNQLVAMVQLIKHRGLDKDLRNFPDINACRHFALRYNGSGYAKNNYHNKLHDAYIRWSKRQQPGAPMHDTGVLRIGSSGSRVRAMQSKLNDLGYLLKADDKFGTRTRDMVLAWQADNDRLLDGEMDAEDLAALEVSSSRPISAERSEATIKDVAEGSTIVQNGITATKITTAGATVLATAEGAQQVGLLDQASDIADNVQKASGVVGTLKEAMHTVGLDSLLSFLVAHPLLIGAGVLGVTAIIVYHIIRARVEMHRNGEAI